ncbi:KEOPS complex subunit Cgi121 [Halobacteria archaeon AArc-dxtr1]|nr:KEOPS complex subunit Cgi121 [Halobacteria archaeon AArc-dxtr1]
MRILEGRLTVSDLDAFVAELGEIGDRYGVTIQAFDARYVAGETHLERAVALADRAIARGENVARDRAVEILLYAAGRRQIDRALEMGVSEGGNRVAIVVAADAEKGDTAAEERACEELEARLELSPEPTLSEPNAATLSNFFEITEAEREATDATLVELVCERVVLLEVEK